MNYKHHHVVLGGTFDFLHLGHKAMLAKAFEMGKSVTIGLTSDQFNKKRGKPSFQNQAQRSKNLKHFLKEKDYLKRCQIVLINDIFGTTLKDSTLQAIVVSPTTESVAHLINKKRVKKGLKALDITIAPFAKDKTGQIISATRIRSGEINALGQSYKNMLLKIAGKRLTNTIRERLKKPLGKIVTIDAIHKDSPIVAVGDVTTLSLLQGKIQPKLAIVDLKVHRKRIPTNLNPNIQARPERTCTERSRSSRRVKNPPGQISKSLIMAIANALKNTKKQTILVEGEEDLSTIPAILLAPLGTTVLYGQPKKGMVGVKVDLKIKDLLIRYLNI